MPSYVIHLWRKAPFLRLLTFLAAGIILQDTLEIPPLVCVLVTLLAFPVLFFFYALPAFKRYRFSFITGIAVAMIFVSLGAFLTWHQDIRHDKDWVGHHYSPGDILIASLDEPLVEKNKSFKADATIRQLSKDRNRWKVAGKIILYFKKDTSITRLSYGSVVAFKKPLQEIRSSGNPGSFDFKSYCLYLGITHQVYLQPGDFTILPFEHKKKLNQFVFRCREWILDILRTYIRGEKELGLAEALLIGYKNDLDKTLVQSYTNTGVVHVIAISGLHLGIIYLLLTLLLKTWQKGRVAWLRAVVIIAGLWLFTLLAGAQPSVLRSAVMFTCIVLAEVADRRSSIYNTLAFSAFLLLCYNPFWIWNAGFQLSYIAVLSIVIFNAPVYHLLYCKNKIIDAAWKLNAVTLAAQILTTPISIFHFHQFPNYFLLTNCIAIPLSSIILVGEILLSILSLVPVLASFTGHLLASLIAIMNGYVEKVSSIPYSVWGGLQIDVLQLVLLFIMIAGISLWLMECLRLALKTALVALAGVIFLRSYSFYQSHQQAMIIVYNVPQQAAIDLVSGRNFMFLGDSSVLFNPQTFNFNLQPSRVKYRLRPSLKEGGVPIRRNYIRFHSKNLLVVDRSFNFIPLDNKPVIDVLVISHNPRLVLNELINTFDICLVVFDASNSYKKLNTWKKECDALGIVYHDVAIDGAFVMNLP